MKMLRSLFLKVCIYFILAQAPHGADATFDFSVDGTMVSLPAGTPPSGVTSFCDRHKMQRGQCSVLERAFRSWEAANSVVYCYFSGHTFTIDGKPYATKSVEFPRAFARRLASSPAFNNGTVDHAFLLSKIQAGAKKILPMCRRSHVTHAAALDAASAALWGRNASWTKLRFTDQWTGEVQHLEL